MIERELEILGEIAKRISPAMKSRPQEIPWSAMVGQRNVIAHEYETDVIDHDKIWHTVTQSVPRIAATIEQYLAEHPPDPES